MPLETFNDIFKKNILMALGLNLEIAANKIKKIKPIVETIVFCVRQEDIGIWNQ